MRSKTSFSRHFPARLLVALLIVLTALLAACDSSASTSLSATPTPPTATATPTPTCASALPGSTPISLGPGFNYPMTYPPNTVGTSPTLTVSGTGLFSVYTLNACTPGTTVSAASSFYTTQLPALPHGWDAWHTFPYDGGLMQTCSAPCFWDPKGGPFYFIVFDQFSDRGNGVVTYRIRYATFDAFPSCGSNFTVGPPAAQDLFFVPSYTPALPLPPVSSTVPDNASGGVRSYDICSPGTTASITAFMTTELPATGWTKIASDSHCIYADQCWKNGSAIISWSVTGFTATEWHIAWRQSLS
jgi:hypothetical protein